MCYVYARKCCKQWQDAVTGKAGLDGKTRHEPGRTEAVEML